MAQSPQALLQQCVQQCDQMKQQLVSSMTQIPDQKSRTAFQMAINAVDSCIAQCHTAGGSL